MKKILFIVPKTFADYPGAMHPHVGIAYLMSFLDSKGYETQVIDMMHGYSFEYLLKKIEEFNPDLLGITMYSFSFLNTYKLIDDLKEKTGLPIIVGGVHVSSLKKTVLESTKADYGIKGEGEYPLFELLEGKPVQEIAGLIWREDNEIIENVNRPPIQDLDALPFPDYEKFELEKYTYSSVDKQIQIATSRGCPYSCVYCAVKLSMGQNFRPRSPENVVEELEKWFKKGYTYFEVVDDCFTLDMNRAKRICDLILEKDLKITWRCGSGIRADRADEEMLQKMKDAGCIYTAFGFESGDPEVMLKIKKSLNIEEAKKTFTLAKKIGLKTSVNFIIGLPYETYDAAMRSIKVAETLDTDYANFHNIIPFPGTEAYTFVQEHGKWLINPDEFLNDASTMSGEPLFETKEFTKEERKKALAIGLALTRKMHLSYRLGPVMSTVLWPLIKTPKRYKKIRSFIFGTKLGRVVFKTIKKK